MIEQRIDCAGLSTIAVGRADAGLVVVVLHGRSMQATDLSPFAHALGLDARFLFPDAPLPAEPRGFSWWPVAVVAPGWGDGAGGLILDLGRDAPPRAA